MSAKGKSRRWVDRQRRDQYVRAARDQGYRSRASYKLLEMDRKDKLLKRGAVVVELGAAPGGWTQVAVDAVGAHGKVVAVDLVEIAPIKGASLVQGDFDDAAVRDRVSELLDHKPADLVLSDMAPNLTGVRVSDQARAIGLAESALEFCANNLRKGGVLVVKTFHGEGFESLVGAMRGAFRQVMVRKPGASRADSRECYLLGRGHTSGRGNP